jgi:hypothetical protein
MANKVSNLNEVGMKVSASIFSQTKPKNNDKEAKMKYNKTGYISTEAAKKIKAAILANHKTLTGFFRLYELDASAYTQWLNGASKHLKRRDAMLAEIERRLGVKYEQM